MRTKNLDVADLKRHYDAFRLEIERMGSTYRFNVGSYDIDRLKQYVSVLQEKVDNIDPPVDRPKWHDPENHIEIGEIKSDYEFDNAAVAAFLRKFDATFYELANSQSGDMSGGLQPFDQDRLEKGLDELVREIALIEKVQPIDAPESANINA